MQRSHGSWFVAVLMFGVMTLPANADLAGALTDMDRADAGSSLAISLTADTDDLTIDRSGMLSVGEDTSLLTLEAGDRAQTLSAQHGADLLAGGSDFVGGGSARPGTSGDSRVVPQPVIRGPGEDLSGGDLSFNSDGNYFESSVAPNPTAVGDVRVLNVAWVDATPEQNPLVAMPIPIPGAFLLGAVGLGLVGIATRRFT